MTRHFHIALAVDNVDLVADDYTERLGRQPVTRVPGQYALWRTNEINLSISKAKNNEPRLRHVGIVDHTVPEKTYSHDPTGLLWESFNTDHQDAEITQIFG